MPGSPDDFVRDCQLGYWTQSLSTADVLNGWVHSIARKKKQKAGPDPWEETKQAIKRVMWAAALTCLPCLQVHRDPRFDDLSGEYKPEIFMKTYSFLDSIKKQEKEVMLCAYPWPEEPCSARAVSTKAVHSGGGRQSCSFLLSSSDGSEAAEKMPECGAEGETPAAPESHGEFSAESPLL